MQIIKILGNNLPKDSKLNALLSVCELGHEIHIHELHDNALSIRCYICPYKYVLNMEEENIIRKEMEGAKPHHH